MHRRPQVQDVALRPAVGVEALEDVLTQVSREGWLGVAGLAVDRARTPALQAAAAQAVEHSQLAQDLFHGELLAEEGEVDLGPRAAWGRLDRGRGRRYGGTGRGDHFLCGHVPFVAHGRFVAGAGKRTADRFVVAGGRVAGIDDARRSVVLVGVNRRGRAGDGLV